MKKISLEDTLRLRKLMQRNARPLDYTKWNFLMEDGSCDEFLSVLSGYQNEDGGFGFNLECNNWNPNSAPFTICYALDYMDTVGDCKSVVKDKIIDGILRYLNSGEYLLENGWVGMQGIPSNNDYTHMPWFHYYPQKGKEADIGVTRRLSEFILKYADANSELYYKAESFQKKYENSNLYLVCGVPDYNPVELKLESYNPETWPFWVPTPVNFVNSPDSKFYQGLKNVVEQNLDVIVETLHNLKEIDITPEEDLVEYEKNNPHPDGKKWCVPEQAIGNYYWGTHHIANNMELLIKFNRIDFTK